MLVKLGQTVKDSITGFQGIVTGIVTYITGCNQCLVQPPCKDNGDFVDNRWVDVDRLTVIDETPITLQSRTADGADKSAPRR